MAEWGSFAAAMGLFLLAHALPVRPPVRPWLVHRLGERGFTLGYSLISLLLLGWLVLEAGRAPFVPLWPWAPWQSWVPNFIMPVVILLVALAVGVPNPLSFGGARPQDFDPERPGIVGVARHPLLWALALWALAHLVPNGNLAHALLFGLFALFAFLGMRMIDRRRRQLLGAVEWQRLAARSSDWPFQALLDGRWRPRLGPIDASLPTARLLAAFLAWGGLMATHGWLIGVPSWPILPD